MRGGVNSAYADTNGKGIGDLEIYKSAEAGAVTLAMMLDTSGSMNYIDLPSYNNEISYGAGVFCNYGEYRDFFGRRTFRHQISAQNYQIRIPVTDSDGRRDREISMIISVCPDTPYGRATVAANGTTVKITGGNTSRMNNLKLGLIGLLADGKALSENHRIAMGNFPTPFSTRFNNYTENSGRMVVPADRLTLAHRNKLIDYVNNLNAIGLTPTAQAYPEVAAYMLGTTTESDYVNRNSRVDHIPFASIPHSGFAESNPSTKQGNRYKSPHDPTAQCEGYGIYFLTDGQPNSGDTAISPYVMGNALGLGGKFNINKYPNPLSEQGVQSGTQGTNTSGWKMIGAFAQELRRQQRFGVEGLRTATVGFGDIFSGFQTKTYASQLDSQGKPKVIPDCNSAKDQDAKNLCLLGSLDADYGRGGFTSTGDPAELAESVTTFIATLKQEIDASPSGTIAIPRDPLSISRLQPYAYLPIIEPKPAENPSVWQGNLKKYHTLNSTLYGQNGVRLYQTAGNTTQDNANFPFAFNTRARDIWQQGTGHGMTTGGAQSHIPTPNNKTSQRSVFVEVLDKKINPQNPVPKLHKITIENGKIKGYDKDIMSNYNLTDIAYIANYLGFAIPVEKVIALKDSQGRLVMTSEGVPKTENVPYDNIREIENAIATVPLSTKASLGGVLHSVPALATYSGQFDNDGNITTDETKRDDKILYGSMEGALHMVNAKDGKEYFSFIPRAMFDNENQRRALKAGTTSQDIGKPAFGVDAPWVVNATYDHTLRNNITTNITAKTMYSYGGLRMGGIGLYGLDITNKDNPSLLFTISNNTTGFERLGQTWARPLPAKIKIGRDDSKDVLIFGGGYDMCYENPQFVLDPNATIVNLQQPCQKAQAQGNAIYMIDAKTGELLKSWTDDSMKHSIVGEITKLDRNNNGYVDHLYFADLGGKVFRIDLEEGVNNVNQVSKRLVQVFDANEGNVSLAYRFYDKPVVSVYKDESGTANTRFALINIASGDRSSPLHKHRTVNNPNRLYGIIDDDVASINLYTTDYQLQTQNVKTSDLALHDPKQLEKDRADGAKILQHLQPMQTRDMNNGKRIKKGWYYNLDRFDGFIGVPHLKALGSGHTDGSIYYASVYSPDYNYNKNTSSCVASIFGASERQMYCLPWGVCAKKDGSLIEQSKNGTLGFIKAGPGIQEMAVGTVTKTDNASTRFRTLLGHRTLREETATTIAPPLPSDVGLIATAKTGNNTGSSKESKRIITGEQFVMDVRRWYDLQVAQEQAQKK